MMNECFCLDETGELCDGCFDSWASRHGCAEASSTPPAPPDSLGQYDEDPVDDDPREHGSCDMDLEPEQPCIRPLMRTPAEAGRTLAASVSRNFVPPRDAYGDYLKRAKTEK